MCAIFFQSTHRKRPIRFDARFVSTWFVSVRFPHLHNYQRKQAINSSPGLFRSAGRVSFGDDCGGDANGVQHPK